MDSRGILDLILKYKNFIVQVEQITIRRREVDKDLRFIPLLPYQLLIYLITRGGTIMSQAYSIELRKKRWTDFLNKNGKDRHLFIINYEPDNKPRPPLHPDYSKEHIEWAWEQYIRHSERTQWLYDDSIPYLDMLTGTEIFAEAFGCKVHRTENNNPFALPMVRNVSEAIKIKPIALYNSTLVRFFEMADVLKDRAGDDAILRLVDIQTPMDIAALIWEKNDFYISLLEEPEAVKELSAKVYSLLTSFLDEWFMRYGKDFIAHFPPYYMPYGISVSEDEIGVINSEMFMEFFYPELSDLSQRYGGIGIHCCANSRHQWENFKKIPGLKLININQPEKLMRESWGFFAKHAAQWPAWLGQGEPWTWPSQHPSEARIVLEVTAYSKEQALELSEKLQKACGR